MSLRGRIPIYDMSLCLREVDAHILQWWQSANNMVGLSYLASCIGTFLAADR